MLDIPHIKVNLRNLHSVEDEIKAVQSALRKAGLNQKKNLLYTGVGYTDDIISIIYQFGARPDQTNTFAQTAEDIVDTDTVNGLTAFDYALPAIDSNIYHQGYILVYNPDELL
jgi:hypothetical protein